ncbi:hypothetical protein DYU11_05760 [Fibrisoma montanum]|uniref:DUF2029 domain-containing protein n=1 Tax=Fibrisoma montanum TaxID=2305895 RepID=A0A418MK71_9BACT|nr:hypothetical protein [Fibrisoma montanum]RIV27799.1 hypothetical protein DYU11_05760 [Fibrisoma montanum]
MTIILIKILVAIGGSVAFGLAYWRRSQLVNLPEATASRLLLSAFVLCRLVPFVVIYVVLGLEPRSDVPVFYDSASHALRAEVVYRDFWSPYSPLFAYMTALPLVIWHSAKAIVLLMILMEGLAFWLTYRFYRPRRGGVAQLAGLLYLLLPAPLVFCVIGGQEDIWMWVFGALSLWVWSRRPDEFRLGLLMAVALLMTKALAVLIVAALFFWVRRPLRYVAGLSVVGLPGLVILYWLTGEGMLTPLMFANMPFAPNLPTVMAPFIGDFMPYAGTLSALGLLAVLAVSAYGGWQLRRKNEDYDRALPTLWVLCFGFMMFVHKSSFGNYAFIYLLPLSFGLIDWRDSQQVVVLLVLNALVTVQPSYWWKLGTPIYTSPDMLTNGQYLLEYVMEVGTVSSVAYFVWLAFRQATANRHRAKQRIAA